MKYYRTGFQHRLRLIRYLNLYKTIRLNFHFFPIRKALKFPILLFGKVDIGDCLHTKVDKHLPENELKSGIVLKSAKTGILMFGILDCLANGFYCDRKSRLSIKGKLVLGDSRIKIGNGTSVVVEENGQLTMGGGIVINDFCRIYCEDDVCIGKGCRISWETQIFDTNFHYMINQNNKVRRMTGRVDIGNDCWIGNRVTVQKGTILPDKSIVASNSLINKDFSGEGTTGSVYAGCPAVLKSKGYSRIFDFELQNRIDIYFLNHPEVTEISISEIR